MEFDFEVLLTPAEDQQVRLFTPPPGSSTVGEWFATFAAVGTGM